MDKKKTNKEPENRKKLINEISEELQKFNDLDVTEKLVKDNVVEFEYNKKKYRVKKPNFKQKSEIRKARTKKYVELLGEDGYLLRKQLVKKLKKKGIDIDSMENDVNVLQAEIDDIRERLAPIEDKKVQEKLKNEILSLLKNQQDINIDITDYLEPCIENELEEFANLYTIFLVLEIQKDDKWIKVFKNYDDFQETRDDSLITQAAYYISIILFRRRIGNDE